MIDHTENELGCFCKQFVNLTPEHLAHEHLCCIIRSKKTHPGVEAKRQWLSHRLSQGHVFRKLNAKGCVFIEYAPLETAWVPMIGANFLYIYCLWTTAPYKGKGYGRALMEYCLADARAKGKSGVCMLGANKQKAWLTDQSFAKSFGFQAVDTTQDGYELLALSFDGTAPQFTPGAKASRIERQELTIYYDLQSLCVARSRNRPAVLPSKRSPADPHPGGNAGASQGVALRIQQLGSVLSGKT